MRAISVLLLTLLLVPATASGAKPKRAKVLTAITRVQRGTHFASGKRAARAARRAFKKRKFCKAANALARHHRLAAKRRLRKLDARSVKARILVLRSLRKGKGCGGKPTVAVDTAIKAPPKLPDGTVTASTTDAEGHSVDFATGTLLASGSKAKAAALARRLHGKIAKDLTHNLWLLKVKPGRANPDKLATTLARLGGKSKGAAATVSSQAGVNTIAAAGSGVRSGLKVGLDFVGAGFALADGSATEDGDGPTGFADTGNAWNPNPFHWKYLQQTGVPAAWQLLARTGRTANKVGLAVLDMGFSPTTDPSDFGSPLKDFSDVPLHGVGDANLGSCGDSICPWHGTEVANTAFATLDDQHGTAGVGGPVADRIVGYQYYDFATSIVGIFRAEANGAKVVNMSYGAAVPYYLAWSVLPFEAATAIASDSMTLVAAAGNDGANVDDEDCFIACWENTWWTPCENAGVICVGALEKDGTKRASYSNYGNEQVDIFAPGTVLAGHEPPTPPATIVKPVHATSGTSFASPYVAGVAALIRAANPSLGTDQVESAMMDTATASSDQQVRHYVNTLAAVRKVLPRTVHISSPTEGAVYDKGPAFTFSAFAYDPAGAAPSYVWKNGDTVIGSGPTISTASLPYGPATITVTAGFSSGPVVSDVRHITIKNTLPTLNIKQPNDGATFFQGEKVLLKSDSSDINQPDAGGRLRPNQIAWSRDGAQFATGEDPTLDLTGVSLGAHIISVRGVDDAGAAVSDGIKLNVAAAPPNLPPSVEITSPADGSVEDSCCTEPPPDMRPYGTWDLQADATDPEDDPLTYTWTEQILPSGSPATISTVQDPGPAAHVHEGGCNDTGTRITLTVSDGVNTRSDSITVGYNLIC